MAKPKSKPSQRMKRPARPDQTIHIVTADEISGGVEAEKMKGERSDHNMPAWLVLVGVLCLAGVYFYFH